MADTKKMSKEEATKRYNISMKRLRKRPVAPSTEGKIMKLFSGVKSKRGNIEKTKSVSPGNVAERFDKFLKGAPLTSQQRTSLYNAANTVYKNFLKDAEKGITSVEKKIKNLPEEVGRDRDITPSSKKIARTKKQIPRGRARIAAMRVQDPEVGQEGPYKDNPGFTHKEGKLVGEAVRYERKKTKQNKAHGGKVYANGSRKPKTR